MSVVKPLAITAVALAVSLPTAALAAGSQASGPAALKPNLPSKSYSWKSPQGQVMTLAPKGWKLSVTKSGEGRFNDPTHTFLLAVAPFTGDSKATIKQQVADLKQSTEGLKILQHTGWMLTYTYDRANGERRWVSYEYGGSEVVEVAGRTMDVKGLQSVMGNAGEEHCG